MKKIGSGLQYDVFEESENNVLKIPCKNLAMIRTMLKWRPKYYVMPFKFVKNYQDITRF